MNLATKSCFITNVRIQISAYYNTTFGIPKPTHHNYIYIPRTLIIDSEGVQGQKPEGSLDDNLTQVAPGLRPVNASATRSLSGRGFECYDRCARRECDKGPLPFPRFRVFGARRVGKAWTIGGCRFDIPFVAVILMLN